MHEFELIEFFKRKIPRGLQGVLGIGDDAEILPVKAGTSWVWTTDTLVEGVDFLRSGKKPGVLTPEQAGYKALAVNLSDLAAMGARPEACLVTLGIPKGFPEAWVKRFYTGLVAAARRYRVRIAGGDLTGAPVFFVSVAMAGSVPDKGWITRKGACPGDGLWVTGELGGSILGRHGTFTPRLAEARFLAEVLRPHAMIDLSDGLVQDLGHLLTQSKTGAELDAALIPVSAAAERLAKGREGAALEHACTDGEDFELLFAMPAAREKRLASAWKKAFPRVRLTRIGRMTAAKNRIEWCRNGKRTAAPRFRRRGFTHF